MFIKARRIRSLEEKHEQRIEDSIDDDFRGLVNYGIMALIQLTNEPETLPEEPVDDPKLMDMYKQFSQHTKDLMMDKNHDYGEVWREMRVSSFTDLILMKLLRIKQIEDNAGQTKVSEGIDSNYMDIINYAVFALIKLEEQKAEAV